MTNEKIEVAVSSAATSLQENPLLKAGREHNPQGFSFTDVTASLVLPFSSSRRSPQVELPALTLVSISSHRDVYPVVGGSSRGIKGFTKGHQTVAGTLGFDSMGSGAFAEALFAYSEWRGYKGSLANLTPDQLPPMTLQLLLMKTLPDESEEALPVGQITVNGIQIIDFASNVSVRDVLLTEVYSFIAGGLTYLIPDSTVLPMGGGRFGTSVAFDSSSGSGVVNSVAGVFATWEATTAMNLARSLLGGYGTAYQYMQEGNLLQSDRKSLGEKLQAP